MNQFEQYGKSVYEYYITDTATAWQVATRFMEDAGFAAAPGYRGIYSKIDPAVGMQYLEFFKTEKTIWLISYVGGVQRPVSLMGNGAPAIQKALENIRPLLDEWKAMEDSQSVAETPEQTPRFTPVVSTPPPSTPLQNPYSGAPQGGTAFTYANSQDPQNINKLPDGYVGYQSDYDVAGGVKKDRHNNAIAGLVFGIAALLISVVFLTLQGISFLAHLGWLPFAAGLWCGVSGLKSDIKAIAISGFVVNGIAAFFIIATVIL